MPFYTVDHDHEDDPLLEWTDDPEKVQSTLEECRTPYRATVHVYSEDEFDSDGVNKCYGHINGEGALYNLERGRSILSGTAFS